MEEECCRIHQTARTNLHRQSPTSGTEHVRILVDEVGIIACLKARVECKAVVSNGVGHDVQKGCKEDTLVIAAQSDAVKLHSLLDHTLGLLASFEL